MTQFKWLGGVGGSKWRKAGLSICLISSVSVHATGLVVAGFARGCRRPSARLPRRRRAAASALRHNVDDSSESETHRLGELGETNETVTGEIFDVSFDKKGGGSYSWSASDSSSDSPDSGHTRRYRRVQFECIGSVLVHHEPNLFVQPNRSEKKSGKTGVTLWSASFVIGHYIDSLFGSLRQENGISTKRLTMLDIGAGLGLTSAVAIKHGLDVLATDNGDAEVMALLSENIERNKPAGLPNTYVVESLEWISAAENIDLHPAYKKLEGLGGADIITLSDVIYKATEPAWTSLIEIIKAFRTQKLRLCKDGDETTPLGNNQVILLGYTHRRRDMSPQDEAKFFALLMSAGFKVELIHSHEIPNSEKYMLTSLFQLKPAD